MVASQNCVPKASLAPDELQRLYRFASIPHGFEEWQQRDCYPRRVEDGELLRLFNATGVVVDVAGHDAYVTDAGTAWIAECPKVGLAASAPLDPTGSDLLNVTDRMSQLPEFSQADIREIGVGKARRSQGNGVLWAMSVGTSRSLARVHCFEDVGEMVSRAAAALREAEAARR